MKKKLFIVTLITAVIMLCSCFEISEVKSITFTKAPESSYEKGTSVDASKFEVLIETTSEPLKFYLTNKNLTVSGLIDGKLDTATPGTKSLTVSYQGFSIVIYYEVTGEIIKDAWESTTEPDISDNCYLIKSPENLAYLSNKVITKDIKLTSNIDLNGKYFDPITSFDGVFDGQNYTISNMMISETEKGAALIKDFVNGEIKNISFDSPIITSTGKECAVVAGRSSEKADLVENITITNASIKGLSCVAGLVGRLYSENMLIQNCYVQGTFSTNNPILSTFGDGEGDKVGGLVGQEVVRDNSYIQILTIKNCQVLAIINATRDAGGLIGWGESFNLEGNEILEGSEIKAFVPGGVRYAVGTRNVGALVGTLAGTQILGANSKHIFLKNSIAQGVILSVDEVYEQYSSKGLYVGGLRRDQCYNDLVITINENSYTISGFENLTDQTEGDRLALLKAFAEWQKNFLSTIKEN